MINHYKIWNFYFRFGFSDSKYD